MEAIFVKYDADKDGKINLEETRKALVEAFAEMINGEEEIAQFIEEITERGFVDVDSDKDGFITAPELKLLYGAMNASLTQRVNPLLSQK